MALERISFGWNPTDVICFDLLWKMGLSAKPNCTNVIWVNNMWGCQDSWISLDQICCYSMMLLDKWSPEHRYSPLVVDRELLSCSWRTYPGKSKKQALVSLSTTKGEYYALGITVKQHHGYNRFGQELFMNLDNPTCIYSDNIGAVGFVRYHFTQVKALSTSVGISSKT